MCLTGTHFVVGYDPLPTNNTFQGEAESLCCQDTALVQAVGLPLDSSHL